MPIKGGRQWAPTENEIRDDHVARYYWAAGLIEDAEKVLDLGCGVGYGAAILARDGAKVTAVDNASEAIAYAKTHFAAENITFRVGKAESKARAKYDAVVAFEVIEHVEDATGMLAHLASISPVLIGSVPNESIIPFSKARNPYHFRHYTAGELREVLAAAGWSNIEILSQAGKRGKAAEIAPTDAGWTLVFKATAA